MQPGVVVAQRFRLERLLGRGGMGSVWQARHVELDIPCAVKFIEGHLANDPGFRQRFVREARSAAALRSPHVVQILDSGEWEGTPYIAMELLEGETLAARLRREKRIEPLACAEIMAQAARALAKAHAAGIVHRDLKPDNIFLAHDDDRLLVKILDFGVAKIGPTSAIAGEGTETGALLGTPFYMSPEQARGTRSVDHRSDLWSLGVIVFQCLTGKRPFNSVGLGELFMSIILEPLPMPSAIAPDLPPGVDAFWLRAAARPPEERFQSAREFAEALGIALGQPLQRSALEAPRLSNPGPAAPGLFTPPASSQSGTPLGAGFGQSAPGSTSAKSTFSATNLPRPGRRGLMTVFAACGIGVAVGLAAFVFVGRRGASETAAADGAAARTAAPTPLTADPAPTVATPAPPAATETAATAAASPTPSATATASAQAATTVSRGRGRLARPAAAAPPPPPAAQTPAPKADMGF